MEKLLLVSNFSFSNSVFYTFGELYDIFIELQIVVCKLSIWKSLKFVVWETVKELTHYHTILHFDAPKICSCGKHCEKGEIACNKQFLLFSRCFLHCMALIFHFKCTLKCHLQFVSIWTSLKFCRLAMG